MAENNFNSEVTEKNMDGYFYLNSNNEKAGPVVPTEFDRYGINENTMIWKEGMSNWIKAGQIPELSQYFRLSPPPPPPVSGSNLGGNKTDEHLMPNNNMEWAILSTILCWPIGIYSLIQSSKVSNLYFRGQYKEAQEKADSAKKWVFISLGISLVCWVFYVLISVLRVILSNTVNPQY